MHELFRLFLNKYSNHLQDTFRTKNSIDLKPSYVEV